MTCETCRHAAPHPLPVVQHRVCAHPRAYRPHGVLPATAVVLARTEGRCWEAKR